MTTTNSARSAHGRAPAAPPSEALKDGKDPLSIGLQARSQLVGRGAGHQCAGPGPSASGQAEESRRPAEGDRPAALGARIGGPEWAQHIAEEWQAQFGPAGSVYRRLGEAGLQVTPPSSPYTDQEAVQDAFLKSLAAIENITVVPLPAANAREGLRDQILQRAPGRRKEGVKTGGADSGLAWGPEGLRRWGSQQGAPSQCGCRRQTSMRAMADADAADAAVGASFWRLCSPSTWTTPTRR